MPAGRPPQPQALQNLKGCSNHRRKNQQDLKAASGAPACPKYLDATARTEWKYVCSQLNQMKILTKADKTAIELYCVAYSRYRTAQKHVEEEGAVIVQGKNNYRCCNPWASEMNSQIQLMQKFHSEYAMSASSRSRLRTAKEDDVEDTGTAAFFRMTS